MKRLVIYYNFIVVTTMVLMGFVGVQTYSDLISSILFFPLAAYFWLMVVPTHQKSNPDKFKAVALKVEPERLEKVNQKKLDFDRRTFLKLIGSAGLAVFFFSIFTKRAHGAFFGSIPGPGTISVKDSTGNVIDPAIKTPTDGYKITQIDDATSTTYFGYMNKDGAWYISREDSSGNYRYTKGASDFSTNWTNRASLTYDYFDNIF